MLNYRTLTDKELEVRVYIGEQSAIAEMAARGVDACDIAANAEARVDELENRVVELEGLLDEANTELAEKLV